MKSKRSTKMLHVSFSGLWGKVLEKDDLKKLRKRYVIPQPVAEFLEGKRFNHPGDILRHAALSAELSTLQIFKMVVPPFYDETDYSFIADGVSSRSLEVKETDLSMQMWTLNDGTHRCVIHSIDTEIISVNLDSSNEIVPSTLKIAGFWFWEWPKLSLEVKKKVFARLTHPNVRQEIGKLARLRDEDHPTLSSTVVPLRKIGQIVQFFINTTGDVAPGGSGMVDPPPGGGVYDPGQPMDRKDNPDSDACTGVPDWPFEGCCIAHDYCYDDYYEDAHGCDECARFECDLDFLYCMLSIAGANPLLIEMAYIFFMGVRSFGAFRFEYCDFPGVSSAVASAAGAIALTSTVIAAVLGNLGLAVAFAAAGVGAVILATKIMCGVCEYVEDWAEECTKDTITEEEKCKKKKKKCKKKKKWWKRLKCKFKYFWKCTIYRRVKKGVCWLVRKADKLVCG